MLEGEKRYGEGNGQRREDTAVKIVCLQEREQNNKLLKARESL